MSHFTHSRSYKHAGRSGFPFRAHRCTICGHLSIGTGPDGEKDYCAEHMPVNYHQLGIEEFSKIADLVGTAEADQLQDLAFPGPIGMVINSKDFYSWAKATRLSVELSRVG